MAVKQKFLDLNTKLEVTCVCELSGSSRSKLRQTVWTDFFSVVRHLKEQRQNMISYFT